MLTVENVEGTGACGEERTLIPHREGVGLSVQSFPSWPVSASFPQSLSVRSQGPSSCGLLHLSLFPDGERWGDGSPLGDACPFATEPGLHEPDPVSKVRSYVGLVVDSELTPACEASLWSI